MIDEEFYSATGRHFDDTAGQNDEKAGKNGGKSLTEARNNDIIEPKNIETAGNKVHYVGKLDKSIYECITKDITTDEVIITVRQLEHIKEHHPHDYERFGQYLDRIIRTPDYIIEANRPNSALILKNITEVGEQFKTVLRIATSVDNPHFKNSIITFMKIDEKEWKRLLKNKKILYKPE